VKRRPADRVPVAPGAKVTDTAQLAPGASELGQLGIAVKSGELDPVTAITADVDRRGSDVLQNLCLRSASTDLQGAKV
jgi:hypothetical protein